ncbi:helix-turn-helix domain-containing protein [Klebsiella pneumoniae]
MLIPLSYVSVPLDLKPQMTVGAVAKRFNVSRMTIYRYTTKS